MSSLYFRRWLCFAMLGFRCRISDIHLDQIIPPWDKLRSVIMVVTLEIYRFATKILLPTGKTAPVRREVGCI